MLTLSFATHPVSEPPTDAVEGAELYLVDHVGLLKCSDAEKDNRYQHKEQERDSWPEQSDYIRRPIRDVSRWRCCQLTGGKRIPLRFVRGNLGHRFGLLQFSLVVLTGFVVLEKAVADTQQYTECPAA